MAPLVRVAILLIGLWTSFCLISSFPHSSDTEIVMVEEIVRYSNAGGKNSTATLITLDAGEPQEEVVSAFNDDNESLMEAAAAAQDDLIFPVKKPRTQKNQQQHETYHQIDLLTSAEEDSLTSASASAERQAEATPDADADTDADEAYETHETQEGEGGDGGVAPEIELRIPADQNGRTGRRPMAPIDMSDFVALIPAAEVKAIADNYYRNDPEVQRAYAFLSSRDFAALKQHIIAIPEMANFLRYLNSSGLDVVGFLYTLTNLTSKAAAAEAAPVPEQQRKWGNEIEKVQHSAMGEAGQTAAQQQSVETTITTTIAAATAAAAAATTTSKEQQLNGLHGLVDSILDILPQDQILTTFFDKLEANEQFSKLVDSIGSPTFAKILSNMENSVPLRNLIFTLHNNGIYITRIVDSLKAYFFLAAF